MDVSNMKDSASRINIFNLIEEYVRREVTEDGVIETLNELKSFDRESYISDLLELFQSELYELSYLPYSIQSKIEKILMEDTSKLITDFNQGKVTEDKVMEAIEESKSNGRNFFMLTIQEVLDRYPLSPRIFSKVVESLESMNYFPFIEAIPTHFYICTDDINAIGGVLAKHWKFEGLLNLLEKHELFSESRDQINEYISQAIENLLLAEQKEDYESLTSHGFLEGHQKAIKQILGTYEFFQLPESTLMRVIRGLDQNNFFSSDSCGPSKKTNFYGLAELYLRVNDKRDRELLERLFIKSTDDFIGGVDESEQEICTSGNWWQDKMRKDDRRFNMLPKDPKVRNESLSNMLPLDRTRRAILTNPDLSDAMKEGAKKILDLCDGYQFQFKCLPPPKDKRGNSTVNFRVGIKNGTTKLIRNGF